MTLIALQIQITAQKYYKIIIFTFPLLNVVLLQYCLQAICCFLESHATCQFRILLLPVLDVVCCAVGAQN
jgi:hypothetical protein